MIVKVCGITRPEDAAVAVAAGATAIGFVFWPRSPRYVEPRVAAQIASELPPDIVTVGVFVDESIDVMRAIADDVGLKAVQLHGNEPPSMVNALGRPVWRALTVGTANAITGWPAGTMLLLDAIDPEKKGGTGHTVDWTGAARIAAARPVVLAGGLTPDNVAGAIAIVRPWGVDVSSGVEVVAGVKDAGKVRRFVAEARRALAGQAPVATGQGGRRGGTGGDRD